MKVVFDNGHSLHDPTFFLVRGQIKQSTEQPERAERLLAGVRDCGFEVSPPTDFGDESRRSIHSDRYLRFLEGGTSAVEELMNATGYFLSRLLLLNKEIRTGIFSGVCLISRVVKSTNQHTIFAGGAEIYIRKSPLAIR